VNLDEAISTQGAYVAGVVVVMFGVSGFALAVATAYQNGLAKTDLISAFVFFEVAGDPGDREG